MSPEATVSRFRISAIWPATTSRVLDQPGSDEAGFPLTGPASYAALLRRLVRGGPERPTPPWDGVGLPWADKREEKFWLEYTTELPEQTHPRLVPRKAANKLVPVHVPGVAPERPPWKLRFHHFVYPFGVASLLHAEYPHPDQPRQGIGLALNDVVEACYDLRGESGAGSGSSWDEWVSGSVGAATPLLGGAQLHPQVPLTVVTFLEVDDVLDLQEGERDRVLNALTGWPERATWSKAVLAKPTRVQLANPVEGRVVHAARRGRSIWFPDGFSGGTTLSETHRRLCFMTMQTEMLASFMVETAKRLDDLPPAWADWAPTAARTIGLVYGDDMLAASESTSPREQIRSSDAVDDINRVRTAFNQAPLHA